MTADVDLYVRYNAKPTSTNWDCRPYLAGTNEECSFSAPEAGRWWIGVNNWAVGTINYTVQATATTVSCTYSISATSASFTATGGSSSVNVTADTGCPWSASSSVGWLTTSSSGSGNGTATYAVAANATTSSRTGTLTIAGQTLTVTQDAAPCTYAISASSASFTASGGSSNVT